MIKFCEGHYHELDSRGGIKSFYGNEQVLIDNNDCQHLDCIRKVKTRCPYCNMVVSPSELKRA